MVTGAAELSFGQDMVGFSNVPGEALAIFSRNETHILHGSSVSDWQLNRHSSEAGAIEYSVQDIGWPVLLDDRGILDIRSTLNYGDFKTATMSEIIQPLIDAKKSLLISSLRVRAKDQYRLFFSDNTAIYMGISKGKPTGFFPIDLGVPVRVTCSVEDAVGNEIIFFGSDDGYVYQMDIGTSFDGAEIAAFARLPYNHAGQPRVRKRFSRGILEVDALVSTVLTFSQSFDYGDAQAPTPAEQTFTIQGGGGFWDEDNWDEFVWDEQVIGHAIAYLDGTGINMSLIIRSNTTYDAVHTLQALTYYYRSRGVQR